jgi:hypothetical protein
MSTLSYSSHMGVIREECRLQIFAVELNLVRRLLELCADLLINECDGWGGETELIKNQHPPDRLHLTPSASPIETPGDRNHQELREALTPRRHKP